MNRDHFNRPGEQARVAMGLNFADALVSGKARGRFIIHMEDMATGEVLHHLEGQESPRSEDGKMVSGETTGTR